jgi:hypothetical protein
LARKCWKSGGKRLIRKEEEEKKNNNKDFSETWNWLIIICFGSRSFLLLHCCFTTCRCSRHKHASSVVVRKCWDLIKDLNGISFSE